MVTISNNKAKDGQSLRNNENIKQITVEHKANVFLKNGIGIT